MAAPSQNPTALDTCRTAVKLGSRQFFRHMVGLGLIFATLSASLFLTVDRVGSSLKHVLQDRINEWLADSGWRVEFEGLQFVEGEGIRVRGLWFRSTVTAIDEPIRVPLPQSWEQLESYLAARQAASEAWPPTTAANPSRQVAWRPTHRPVVPVQTTLYVDSLWLRGPWTTADLLQGQFQLESIDLDGVTLDLTLAMSGEVWLPRLPRPAATSAARLPRSVSIRNWTTRVTDTGGRQILAWGAWHGSATQIESAAAGSASEPRKQLAGGGEPDGRVLSTAEGLSPSSTSATAGLFGGIAWSIEAQFPLSSKPTWSIRARVDSKGYEVVAAPATFFWQPQGWAGLAAWLPPQAQVLSGISGQFSLEQAQFRGQWPQRGEKTPSAIPIVAADAHSAQVWRVWGIEECRIVGEFSDLVVQHELLPQPVLQGRARLVAHLDGMEWTEVSGRVSEGHFLGRVTVQNWFQPQVTIGVQGQRLPFNRRWTPLLTDRLQRAWSSFQPEGWFDCDLRFAWQPNQPWQRRGVVDVHDTSYTYRDFPLPVSHINGRIWLEDEHGRFDLESSDPRCPVTIQGFANDMGPNWTGRIDVRSTRFHPYSESLLEGLKRKPEAVHVIQQLNFSGLIATSGFIERTEKDQPADVRFNLSIQGGELRHRMFPYRVFGVSGLVQLVNGVVTAPKLEGVSSTGNITLSGEFLARQQWWVKVLGQAVELNQELYQALTPNQQSIWRQVSPRGTLDHLLVQVEDRGAGVEVTVSGYQQPSTPRDPSHLQIEPTWFPYALDRLSGKFYYRNGELTISDVQGWHGNVTVSFDAQGQTHAEYWQLSINNLLTGQIPVDHEIKRALPLPIRQAADRLQVAGSVAVQGNLSIFQPLSAVPPPASRTTSEPAVGAVVGWTEPVSPVAGNATPAAVVAPELQIAEEATNSGPPNCVWDLRLDLENLSIELGLPVRNVHGNVQLRGLRNADIAYCGGQLNLDSAMVQGVQITTVQGPFWCNDQHVLFGTAVGELPVDVQAQSCGTIAPLTARGLAGRLGLDGQAWLREDVYFQIQATANQVDLATLAAEFAPSSRDIAGQGSASLVLAGSTHGLHTLEGQGLVRVNDAQLYEIPFFLQLLKTLQVKTPDKTAFDEGSIDFSIRGSDIECHRLELNGDAISLIGNGRANLNQELDLNFYTVLGRNRFYLPVLSDLLHAGSQQLLWISVKGTVENPQLTRETFRALNEAVRLLLEDPTKR